MGFPLDPHTTPLDVTAACGLYVGCVTQNCRATASGYKPVHERDHGHGLGR